MSQTTLNSSRCNRCEVLPSPIDSEGYLYIWFPVKHTLNKVTRSLQNTKYHYQLNKAGECLAILLIPNEKAVLVSMLMESLTNEELQSTKALFMPSGSNLELRDCSRVSSLGQFCRLSQSDWLLDMLASERVTSYFQPIVKADELSDIFGQEALFRGIDKDGSMIPPGRIFHQATEAGLLFQLDLLARRSAIRSASKHGIKEQIFINFSPSSLYDPTSCLRSTVQAIDEARINHEQVIFEVVETEQNQDLNHLKNTLDFYRSQGFKVALDDLGSGSSNLNLIHQLRPDLIKLDMDLIRNVHVDHYKATITEKILEIAQQLNIQTVAEGIETQEELLWVKSRGATYVQGYLIAKPAPCPISPTKK